ncbi:MAG: hypothetical protein FWD05_10905 [Oscillospiraceae bacterium]|nr:hypothetical protein [Oscillospiraceae bacterium]
MVLVLTLSTTVFVFAGDRPVNNEYNNNAEFHSGCCNELIWSPVFPGAIDEIVIVEVFYITEQDNTLEDTYIQPFTNPILCGILGWHSWNTSINQGRTVTCSLGTLGNHSQCGWIYEWLRICSRPNCNRAERYHTFRRGVMCFGV